GGYISMSFVENTWLAAIVGALAGGLAFWGATSFTRWLKRSESSASFKSDSLIGSNAKVITDIPAGGYGEVRVYGSGGSRKRSARALTAIPSGTEVWVSGIV